MLKVNIAIAAVVSFVEFLSEGRNRSHLGTAGEAEGIHDLVEKTSTPHHS